MPLPQGESAGVWERSAAEAVAAGPARSGHGGVLQLAGRAIGRLEYYLVRLMGTLMGTPAVVRYLRNPNPALTVRVLRTFGAEVGNNTTIKGSLFIDNATGDANAAGDLSHLRIGRNCYIGEAVFFDLAGEITVEDNAVIAGRASFLTHAECNRSEYLSRVLPRQCAAIIVRNGAWVGFGATALPGVTVGRNAVLGANSLLIASAEPHCVYIGTPAVKHRQLPV